MFAIQKVCLLKPPAYRFDFAENSLPDLGQLIHLWTSVSVTNHPSLPGTKWFLRTWDFHCKTRTDSGKPDTWLPYLRSLSAKLRLN